MFAKLMVTRSTRNPGGYYIRVLIQDIFPANRPESLFRLILVPSIALYVAIPPDHLSRLTSRCWLFLALLVKGGLGDLLIFVHTSVGGGEALGGDRTNALSILQSLSII